ncbi:MAG: MipA/OmpV family protein [Candidatus Andeanibacterium colombiense]|uniref:MipA/OmpV family protein n=1 Tax=Candidatus Andeanibacterium colombiense TaxID=3121345 RepID=A0AAJ5XBV6_9SPHN|nr:MAG: MipA/OmpV family protein [Sphingomonadaceae bacterium]
MKRPLLIVACSLAFATPAAAQIADLPSADTTDTVFDDNWLGVGGAVVYMPSYDGSNDYVLTPIPMVQGKLLGVGINPRQGGVVLDFINDPGEGVSFSLGPSIRLRANRATQVKDTVVEDLGKRKRAVEVGPSVGVSFPKVLNPYDSLSFGVDAAWDVLGAHKGMVIEPSVSYFTPVSKGAALSLTVDAEYGNNRFMDYYYSITPAESLASGLDSYDAKAGFTRVGARLLGAIDLDGDLANGGFSLILIGSYSRMLGEAADSPIVADRGSPNQFLGAVGLGYVF